MTLDVIDSDVIGQDLQDCHPFLKFAINNESFGLAVMRVREIIEYTSLTDLPMAPPYIVGVVDLRGLPVPVLDLAVRFGRAARPVTARTCIVVTDILRGDQIANLGLLVDSVSDVIDINVASIEPPPALSDRLEAECLIGMVRLAEKFIILLDPDTLLSPPELERIALTGSVQ